MGLIGFTTKRDEILFGMKTCTTRLARKNPPKEGELLYLYWKLRTKECKRLGIGICERVVRLSWLDLIWTIENHPEYLKREGAFTKQELINWFQGHYNPDEHTLFDIIEWRDFKADDSWILVKGDGSKEPLRKVIERLQEVSPS